MAELPPINDLALRFAYLDELRQSGVTNMWGAGAYLDRRFGLKGRSGHASPQSIAVLTAWMSTFGREGDPLERAVTALEWEAK
jgi:hypothetical protein